MEDFRESRYDIEDCQLDSNVCSLSFFLVCLFVAKREKRVRGRGRILELGSVDGKPNAGRESPTIAFVTGAVSTEEDILRSFQRPDIQVWMRCDAPCCSDRKEGRRKEERRKARPEAKQHSPARAKRK